MEEELAEDEPIVLRASPPSPRCNKECLPRRGEHHQERPLLLGIKGPDGKVLNQRPLWHTLVIQLLIGGAVLILLAAGLFAAARRSAEGAGSEPEVSSQVASILGSCSSFVVIPARDAGARQHASLCNTPSP